jgi:glutamate-5-semialdehyde dehydrogenase
MIFESRPNVALEAFGLAVKSANVAILRGGKESSQTTKAIYAILSESLTASGLEKDMFWGISDPDRAIVNFLLDQKSFIDVVIPRGGEGLIQFVVSHSKIPIIKNDRGMCHVYVDEKADVDMAIAIVENAKTQRPGVCNAMETLLVHEKIAKTFLPLLHQQLEKQGVEWHGCSKTVSILKKKNKVKSASKKDFDTEYLDLKMNCKVVKNYQEAVTHIETHGSRHSEAIVTQDEKLALAFQNEVDAAAVYWNASTRFTDGFALGLGGEMGISTQKLHVRGPVGLKELTSLRWVMDGSGQVRQR